MKDIELPEELRAAIDDLVIPSKHLSEVSAELSKRYRSGRATRQDTTDDIAAYVAYRMPATFAALSSALGQARDLLGGWSPKTLLDAGAGPGTSMWAATSVWPELEHVTLLERNEGMIGIGTKMAAKSSHPAIGQAKWFKADIADEWPEQALATHDLVIMGYVLGELSKDRSKTIQRLWSHTAGMLVIVEPGTPTGFDAVRQARDVLLSKGGEMVAPCPHRGPCPIDNKDWCHFSQRVARSRVHRQVKSGELAYEDEKFSFIAISRFPGQAIPGRVIRHPQKRPGHILFDVCGPAGIDCVVVTRKDKEMYRKARDTEWGSVMPAKSER